MGGACDDSHNHHNPMRDIRQLHPHIHKVQVGCPYDPHPYPFRTRTCHTRMALGITGAAGAGVRGCGCGCAQVRVRVRPYPLATLHMKLSNRPCATRKSSFGSPGVKKTPIRVSWQEQLQRFLWICAFRDASQADSSGIPKVLCKYPMAHLRMPTN